jgi:hypothetical protein
VKAEDLLGDGELHAQVRWVDGYFGHTSIVSLIRATR